MFTITPPDEIIQKLREDYYKLTGKWVNPSDVESFLIDLIAYNRTQLEGKVNYYRKQNFLRYASGEALDLLGEWLGVIRLPPQPAKTTVRFTFETPHPQIMIDENVKLVAKDNKTIFKPAETVIVPADVETFDVVYECETAGTIGNGFIAGDINQLVSPIAYILKAENITVSTGGTQAEDDEHFRERIRLAPWRFNTAGSRKGYIFWAMTADSSIIDVNAYSDPATPGEVFVIVLTKDLPVPQTVLDKVEQILSEEDVRPLTDLVHVNAVTEVPFDVEVELTLLPDYVPMASQILEEANKRVDEFISETRSKIGKAINPDKLIYKLMDIKGVFKVNVISPVYTEINKDEVGVGSVVGVRVG
ncbi:Phage-related baseplate assembly protein [Persephonella hydrogeniphila]|uniref:Phage-related baseplate assembly protein n=1 Tax=Persephonella hydrogeniphila TaxID=198703 RepID=A0A285NE15_9AQUI|nr:baseplate J/gp47 family protein [Persephonella hydrogeniphila]SNZ07695.1 Phage-related baseplate assembly protein [Persephonella hydrogeniphila]